MKTDKELLELAAKACGFGKELGVVWTKTEWPRDCGIEGALWDCTGHGSTANLWNPLNDDAQALRLAVKLGMVVEVDECIASAECYTSSDLNDDDKVEAFELVGSDPYAATRRAIVRAAAAIGEKL